MATIIIIYGSMIVLNSRDQSIQKMHGILCLKPTLEYRLYLKKLTKMHWYDYNNTAPLSNTVKSPIVYLA